MRALRFFFGLLASLLCGAIVFFLVISLGNLFSYIGFVFSTGFEIANINATEMKVYGNSSNMSSMLFLGALFGFALFLMYVLGQLLE